MHHNRPMLSGWALDLAVSHDAVHPGFLRYLLTQPSSRVHLVLFCLAHRQEQQSVSVQDLMKARSSDLVSAVLGESPQGLRGVLSRLEPKTLPRGLYIDIGKNFSAKNARARALTQWPGALDEDIVSLALNVDEVFLSPPVLDRLRSSSRPGDASTWLQVIRGVVDVDDSTLRQSLADNFSRFPNNWLAKASRTPFPNPVPSDHLLLRPLSTGGEFLEAGRITRTCIGQVAPVMSATGLMAYAITRTPPWVVVECRRRRGGGFILSQVRGVQNRTVERPVLEPVLEALETLNVAVPWSPERAVLRAIDRLPGFGFFDDQFGLDALVDDRIRQWGAAA